MEPTRESERQSAEQTALRRLLDISAGTFSLSFCTYGVLRLRDELVSQCTAAVPGIAVVRLPPQTLDVLTEVRKQVSGQPAAIFVLDLEGALPSAEASSPVLRSLNASREAWERWACPVIFWLAQHATALVAAQAVDFWRYRSHTFDFAALPLDAGQWRDERPLGDALLLGLPLEEKRFRRAELEQRIAEVGAAPTREMLPHVRNWMLELATLHQMFGDFAAAETMLRRALEIDERSFGQGHPKFATDLNNLAALLQATNRLAEAEPLLRRALEIDERSFGKEHPEVATDLNNLAQLLQATSRLAEAEPLMRRALEIDERSFGKEHPDVATDLNNLAQLLQATSRLAEAEPLMRRALQIDERSFGKEHPEVATDLNNLAQLLQATNRLAEAESLMRRALEIDERSFGKEHPNVAIRLNNLAQLLQATNRLAEAEPLMRRALEIDERSFGKEHPEVAIALNNMAQLLQATNRLAEAEPLMRRHLEIFVQFGRLTGHEHPHMQAALKNYWNLLSAMDLSESEIAARMAEVMGSKAQT